jgi:hypothetical protein
LANFLSGFITSAEQVVIHRAYIRAGNVVLRSSELLGIFTERGTLTGKEIIIGGGLDVGYFGLA